MRHIASSIVLFISIFGLVYKIAKTTYIPTPHYPLCPPSSSFSPRCSSAHISRVSWSMHVQTYTTFISIEKRGIFNPEGHVLYIWYVLNLFRENSILNRVCSCALVFSRPRLPHTTEKNVVSKHKRRIFCEGWVLMLYKTIV